MNQDNLLELKNMHDLIKRKETELDGKRETAGGAGAIRYDKLNVQVSVVHDIVERNVLDIIELEEEILALKLRYRTLQTKAVYAINQLSNDNDKTILLLHYIQFYSFRKMADELGKDIRWIKRVHVRALNALNMLYST